MKILDYIKYLVPIVLAGILLVTCNRNYNYPGLVYMPEMDQSLAYEYQKATKNSSETFTDWASTLEPVAGTVPMGHNVYAEPNTPEAYERASLNTINPVELTDESLLRGQQIYVIHCAPCHGPKGTGEGSAVVNSEYRLAKPPINFANPQAGYLTPGRMFHTITHGKGLMGPYASQVSVEDRWNVIHYIESLNENAATAEVVTPEENAKEEASANENE